MPNQALQQTGTACRLFEIHCNKNFGFVTITKEEARFAHQNYYDGEFEVVLMTRCGPFDFFPFSLFHSAQTAPTIDDASSFSLASRLDIRSYVKGLVGKTTIEV